ncbi:MAG: T9SS type A sorting domain-containing protein [Bacteroidetes bacterium]|nr:T9SS type A sorting domain-containing protein [Bacteroidota bacterium]
MKKVLIILILVIALAPVTRAGIIDTSRVYGLTLDAVNGLAKIDTALARLYKKPTARIVFDEWIAASDYIQAINEISKYAFIMGELLDSYYVSQYNLAQYTARANEYLAAHGSKVDIWEIGNEINGEWLGTTSDVVQKMDTAYAIFKGAGKKTALTLYYNKDCYENASNEMFYWVNKNVKTSLRNGLDYVWISYYEDDCNGYQPDWQRVFDSLHVLFPNSKIGFGECGTTDTLKKASYMTRYYRMNITTPNFVGGYFWWYFKKDCVPYTNPMWSIFNSAISFFTPPSVQSSQVKFALLDVNNVTLVWQNGNGTRRAVFMKDGTGTAPNVQNCVTYRASPVFGAGSSDGTGWYCVYNEAGALDNPVITVSGLISGHNYDVMVIEYNGFPGYEGYNKNASLNNPVLIQGFLPISISTFSYTLNRNNVSLKWVTEFEDNNKGFYVERHETGANEWTEAGFVSGKGSTGVPSSYTFEDRNLQSGKYVYRLRQADFNGVYNYHNMADEVTVGIPSKFEMSQNYPNPFNPETSILVALPKDGAVTLKIYDTSGKEIKSISGGVMKAGYNIMRFSGNGLSSGIYFYKVSSADYSDIKKMCFIK